MDAELMLHGVSLKNSVLNHVRDELTSLRNLSPYDSYICCDLTSKGSTFEGELRVSSKVGQFCAQCSDENVASVVDRLFEDLKSQVTDWSSHRTYYC